MASTVSMCWTVEPPLMVDDLAAQMSSIAESGAVSKSMRGRSYVIEAVNIVLSKIGCLSKLGGSSVVFLRAR